MEEIDDDDNIHRNMAPTNKSHILELNDGSNGNDMDMDDPFPSLVTYCTIRLRMLCMSKTTVHE